MLFKVGDEVVADGLLWVVLELPGCSDAFPKCYRLDEIATGDLGLAEEHQIRKLTKLERALK